MTIFPEVQEPPVAATLRAAATADGFGLSCEPVTGVLLRFLAASRAGGNLLELGTGYGVSTAWLTEGMTEGARLTTVDVDGHQTAVARKYLQEIAGIDFVVADAVGWMQTYDGPLFDLIFADSHFGKFENREDALRLVAPGGIYLVDDLLPQEHWPDPPKHQEKVNAFVADLCSREEYTSLSLDWGTGYQLIVRSAAHS